MKRFLLLLFCSIITPLLFGQTEQVISIYFDVDAHIPIPAEEKKLRLFYELEEGSVVLTRIVSYTDKSGSTSHNLELAKRRANSVESSITQIGKADQVIIKGEDYSTTNYVARKYRRVDVFYHEIEPIYENLPSVRPPSSPIETLPELPTNPSIETIPSARPSHLIEEFSTFLLDSTATEATIILSIEFHGGTSNFINPDDPDLWRLFDILHYNEKISVLIRGHVCCGHDIGLSYRRGYAVETFLTKRSISHSRLTTKGYSNTIPRVSPELTEADRRKNRRVDVVFYKEQ